MATQADRLEDAGAKTSPSAQGTADRNIGQPGKPVRVLAFASGGFDTALQLGAIHALLVSRSRAPDIVIGTSAGAVNAVAAAEVLQEGDPDRPAEERLPRRAARFRQIFETYQNCPSDLFGALFPDTYQIDAQRPLEPQQLPIHAADERKSRTRAVESRAGMMNLYNETIRARVTIGTIARGVRRTLGLIAAGALPSRAERAAAEVTEFFRLWVLLGMNLIGLAGLAWPVMSAFLGLGAIKEQGAPAGHLIFRSRFWGWVSKSIRDLLGFAVIAILWALGSTLALALFAVPILLCLLLLRALPLTPAVQLRTSGGVRLRDAPTVGDALSHLTAAEVAGHNLTLVVIALVVLCGVIAAAVAIKSTDRRGAAPAMLVAFLNFFVLYGVTAALLTAAAFVLRAALTALGAGLGWPFLPTVAAYAGAGLLVVAIALVATRNQPFAVALLGRYGLANSFFDAHPLRQVFVRLFDPGYYGAMSMDGVVERALKGSNRAYQGEKSKKSLGDYARPDRSPAIHVAATVAKVSNGGLIVLPETTRVVDGLLAAVAATPLLPPVRVTRDLFVDGKRPEREFGLREELLVDAANIVGEPTRALMEYLRDRVVETASVVLIYPVAPLPMSRYALGIEEPAEGGRVTATGARLYGDLLDVAVRARQLERFRDATLDRKLTEVFTQILPVGNAIVRLSKPAPGQGQAAAGEAFVRAWVYPIEPQRPIGVNNRLTRATTMDERRRIIAETVADGCRYSLQTMIGSSIQAAVDRPGAAAVRCRLAIAHRLGNSPARPPGIPGAASGPEAGPGLVEVCEHCALWRDGVTPLAARLATGNGAAAPPEWPREDDQEVVSGEQPMTTKDPEGVRTLEMLVHEQARTGHPWPRAREGQPDAKPDGTGSRPTVSFLFSGGVFRGVYQMGALNALNEARLTPDVIAGASVGSVTAAMVASAFQATGAARQERILRLAATYMALDRLIITDRFADFIRGFTVRAANTNFSLRDADRVFRKFDKPLTGQYGRQARRVLAGAERLLYISPFEMVELVRSIRDRDGATAQRMVRTYAQEWLNRQEVGNQVLGAEPLALLIAEHVIKELPGADPTSPGTVPFDVFLRTCGIYFLATTTNLTEGRLEILGERQLSRLHVPESLLEGLLASSAFPGVFRPRWSWEIHPTSGIAQQYIDGGVMDNLPLDAVVQFLDKAASAELIKRQPSTSAGAAPHLIVAASLEPHLPELDERVMRGLSNNWPALLKRARQLGYNTKLDLYAGAQEALRRISADPMTKGRGARESLDIEVLAVKPRWLCSTFGFHPMLGFRRSKQAASIAHGCASTLIALGKCARGAHGTAWSAGWGMDRERLPLASTLSRKDPLLPLKKYSLDPGTTVPEGRCWFRTGVMCPFSSKGSQDTTLPQAMRRRLNDIHAACGRPQTHEPR